jgi:cation diffusion facilitator CzcD-associated flavoprotein CzcO
MPRATTKTQNTPHHDVLIVGSGFAGLCMAIQLQKAGQDDFVLIERGNDVGGTWRDNQYPGAACDVPSHLYSFSFEPNTDWSRKYPTQPELLTYLRGVADKHGLRPKIRFNANLEHAAYDVAAQRWTVNTSQGVMTARVVVSGSGGLAEPKLPDINGVESFAGTTFHSSRWNHDIDLAGKRVAVIGTGASAIQFVPEIAPNVGRLDVYQRTPNWIVPRPDRAYSGLEKSLFRLLPITRQLHRSAIYWGHETRVVGMVLNPAFMTLFQKIAERHIARQVADPVLRATVTPDYTIGCKRILISNDWYPAISRDNVDVITDGIREIKPHSIVTADGTEREIDVLIFATGFYATDNPIAEVITGAQGQTLAEAWADGEEAFLGVQVKHFPNLFFVVGPNSGLGHSSMVFMIEAQVRYIMEVLGLMRARRATSVDIRPDVQDRFNARLQQRLGGSIWATGCQSWYQHRSGKITALWPGFTWEFWMKTRRIDSKNYITA